MHKKLLLQICVGIFVLLLVSCKQRSKNVEKQINIPIVKQAFFRIDNNIRESMPTRTKILFEHAEQDMDLISSGQQPIWCKFDGMLLDGGTKIYSGIDYEITDWKELRKIDGFIFKKCGVSIKFKSKFPGAYLSGETVENTWLVAVYKATP